MDDILIPAKNEKENIEKLKLVFDLASKHELEFNWKKCRFLVRQIEYLAFLISESSIAPSHHKSEAVLKFKEPKKVKDIQSLGLTGYFRHFVQNYSILAGPLTNLLKKNVVFKLDDSCRHAFNTLKRILLQRKNLTEIFHPVQFYSKETTDAQKNYHSYELEAVAVVYALRKFRPLVLGLKFKISTDCSSFQKTMNKIDVPSRVKRYALELQE